MGEIIVAVDVHNPRNKRDVYVCRCGARVQKKGQVYRIGDTNDPESMLGASTGPFVCIDCANKLPWTNEAEAELGVSWEDFRPSIPSELDLQAKVPLWFVKALKHSSAVRMAYWLGVHRGQNP